MFSGTLTRLFLPLGSGLILFLAVTGFITNWSPVADGTGLNEPASAAAEIVDLRTESSGLHFTLRTPSPSFDANGKMRVKGLSEITNLPDRPELPYYSTLIVVPPEANVEVVVGTNDISVTPQPDLPDAPKPQLASYSAIEDSFAFSSKPEDIGNGISTQPKVDNQYFPHKLYDLSEPMYMRDLRLVRLSIFPLQYNRDSGQLTQFGTLDISISFTGADIQSRRPLSDPPGQTASTIGSQILNIDQAESWRSIPANAQSGLITLPTGKPVYKIAVDQDGIYELTAEDLSAAGMDIGNGGVNPLTFQMMYRGESIAYELTGNGDTIFDPGERVRFYGWAFSGSRLERQFINENIFWLWAAGDPHRITSGPSVSGETVDFVPYSITEEYENSWFPGYTNRWDFFPNEPDAWFWQIFYTSYEPLTSTYGISLEHPVESGAPAVVTVELSSRSGVNHTATFRLNDQIIPGALTWYGTQNVNVTGTVPVENLYNNDNSIEIALSSESPLCRYCLALNRITVDYYRKLIAVDNQIIFSDDSGGLRQYSVAGFDSEQSSEPFVWNITDPKAPVIISSETISITGTNSFTLTFGINNPTPPTVIAVASENTHSPISISKIIEPDLDPTGGGAEWIAIAYKDFITETDRLADHRASPDFGGLSTHVVDIEKVINQYGYGLPIPAAIQQYLIQAVSNWEIAPRYLLLVGDSTMDPRHHKSSWSDEQHVMTDLVFEDYWQGQIQSDNTFAQLFGDDKLPDLAVGRIAVKQQSELSQVINKIETFERSQLFPSGWMENILFLADRDDIHAGFFCHESILSGDQFPTSFNSSYLCLNDYGSDIESLRQDLFSTVNITGVTLLNYRGHGGVAHWANILSTADMSLWENSVRPFVSLSGDCLDGSFAFPWMPGLGEELIKATDNYGKPVGAAAHWGSSGLGTSDNHSRLIEAFYHALFNDGQVAIGEATMAAKVAYGLEYNNDPNLLTSFILHGDPAMQLFRRSLTLQHDVAPKSAATGDVVTYTIDITNKGIYPSHTILSHTLPTDFQFISATSSVSTSYQISGNSIVFDLQFGETFRDKGIPRDGSVTITIEAGIGPKASVRSDAIATVSGSGKEAWPGDETSTATISVTKAAIFIPNIFR